MRIADNDLRGARRFGASNGRKRLVCHESAESFVLKSARKQLVCGDCTCHTFHIHRYIDFERGLRRL